MSMILHEEEVMPDVKWRAVASAILYDKSGTVVMYQGDVVFKQTFHQVKREGIFNRWIRYETCTRDKLLRVEWLNEGGLLLKSISEVQSWAKHKKSK